MADRRHGRRDRLAGRGHPSRASIPCLPCGSDDVLQIRPGTIDARAGQAAYDAVVAATRLGYRRPGGCDCHGAAAQGGVAPGRTRLPGHTELLAEMCGVKDFAMMLYLGPDEQILGPAGLAVVHVTLHIALRDVFDAITQDAVLSKARLADQFMSRLKGCRPRIGVCALNPHRGEGGLFGHEEQTIIRPPSSAD